MILAIMVIGIIFTYINGMHDGGVVVATMITSKTLSPKRAVLVAGISNFCGAMLLGTAVAKTVGIGIVSQKAVLDSAFFTGGSFIIGALAGGIIWNIITWGLKLPSSSSHALMGGIIGAGAAAYGVHNILWSNVLFKIVLAMALSPLAGLLAGYLMMKLEIRLLKRGTLLWQDRISKMHLVSTILLASLYGSNDAQKPMGMIALGIALGAGNGSFEIPLWLMAMCAASMAIGTITGGWNMIGTVGFDIFKVGVLHSFASQVSTIFVVAAANAAGAPISAGQVITSSVMGVGSGDNPKHVNWNIVKKIAVAWVLTLPAAALLGGAVFLLLHHIIAA